MLWATGLLVSILSFLLGRVFSQSERVIEQKKTAYENFLNDCPAPNEAYGDLEEIVGQKSFQRGLGVLSLYASPEALLAAQNYFEKLAAAAEILKPDSEALDPAFREVYKAYNSMLFEMRRDALVWSVFRLPRQAPQPAIKRLSGSGEK